MKTQRRKIIDETIQFKLNLFIRKLNNCFVPAINYFITFSLMLVNEWLIWDLWLLKTLKRCLVKKLVAKFCLANWSDYTMPNRRDPASLKCQSLQSICLNFETICYGPKYSKGSSALNKYIYSEGYKEVEGPFADWPSVMLRELIDGLYR